MANELLPFATGGGANVLTQADYAGLAARTTGFSAGTALSIQLNKVWRQGAFTSAMIGQFTADLSGFDTLDDGDVATYLAHFKTAVRAAGWLYAVDTGTANALAINLDAGFTAMSKLVGALIRVTKAATSSTSTTPTIAINGLAGVTIKDRFGNALSPGDLPGSADLLLGVFSTTEIRYLGLTAADLGQQKMAFNQLQFTSTTRTVFSAITGFTTFATGTYVKKSSTSNLWIRASANTHDESGIGAAAAIFRINIAANNIDGIQHAGDDSTSSPASNIERPLLGIAAGNLPFTISFGRNDAVAWSSVINPTNTDGTFLPSVTETAVIFYELEP